MVRTACVFSLLAVPLVCFACGGGQPPPPASPSGAASAPAEAADASAPDASASTAAAPTPPGPGEWDTWSKEQKMAYMKQAVMPKLGPMFHDFDAKRFAEPKCALCHGAGVKDGSFKMPNPDLPKLPTTPEGFRKLHEQHPKIVDFMAKDVDPTMASLLGMQPYDPKTEKGFGCFECHTPKK